jgi:hypothetical protein
MGKMMRYVRYSTPWGEEVPIGYTVERLLSDIIRFVKNFATHSGIL